MSNPEPALVEVAFGSRPTKSGHTPQRVRRSSRVLAAQVLPKLSAEDRQLPLYRLLDRIADPTLDEKYRDTLLRRHFALRA